MVDLKRMRAARASQAPRIERKPESQQLAPLIEAIIKRATASGSCLICGGAGWVGVHGDGCPLEALEIMTTTTQPCHACHKDFTITVFTGTLVRPDECSKCFAVSSRGATYVAMALEVAGKRLRKARDGGNPKQITKAKRQATVLVRLLKRAGGS